MPEGVYMLQILMMHVYCIVGLGQMLMLPLEPSHEICLTALRLCTYLYRIGHVLHDESHTALCACQLKIMPMLVEMPLYIATWRSSGFVTPSHTTV